MTTSELYDFLLMLSGAFMGVVAGAPFWCAVTTRVLEKYEVSREDKEISQNLSEREARR